MTKDDAQHMWDLLHEMEYAQACAYAAFAAFDYVGGTKWHQEQERVMCEFVDYAKELFPDGMV